MEIMTDKKGELCPNCSLSSDNSQNREEKPIPNNNTVIFPIRERMTVKVRRKKKARMEFSFEELHLERALEEERIKK